MITIDDVSSWLVWVLPLASSCLVPVVAKYGAKLRDYFVIAIALVTAGFAFSLIPGVFFGQRPSNWHVDSVDCRHFSWSVH